MYADTETFANVNICGRSLHVPGVVLQAPPYGGVKHP